jgi:hypothetical protein
MGKTNTNTASVPAFEMKGKTANELKAALDSGIVTKAAVVAFLKEREAATGLRAPSKKLLADLTETKPAATPTPATTTKVKAKAETPKAEVKVETVTPDMSGILARLAALEAEVASLKAALAADEDEDDADMDDEDMDEDDGDEDEEEGEPMTVEEARDAMNDMALGALRDACRRAGFEPPKGGKAALVEALVQHGIETGMVAAPVAAPVVEVKPEPVKAKPSPAPVKAVKPVKATPASVAASIDLGDDLF